MGGQPAEHRQGDSGLRADQAGPRGGGSRQGSGGRKSSVRRGRRHVQRARYSDFCRRPHRRLHRCTGFNGQVQAGTLQKGGPPPSRAGRGGGQRRKGGRRNCQLHRRRPVRRRLDGKEGQKGVPPGPYVI